MFQINPQVKIKNLNTTKLIKYMICNLSEDLLIFIFKKLHRFNYLDNLFYVNTNFNNITKYIYNFHYTKINNYLNTLNINYIYRNISKNLFNNKILNLKKINNKYINLPINNLVKIFIIFNDYSYNIKSNYIKIISYNELIQPLQYQQVDLYYIPFIMFNLNNKFYIFVEFSYENVYRLRIKSIISNTNVGLYKNISENDILNMISLSKNDLLTKYI